MISRQPQPGAPSITEEPAKRVDFEQVTSKMEMIQQIIDQVFLYDEDAQNVEDFIYRGMMQVWMILILCIIPKRIIS